MDFYVHIYNTRNSFSEEVFAFRVFFFCWQVQKLKCSNTLKPTAHNFCCWIAADGPKESKSTSIDKTPRLYSSLHLVPLICLFSGLFLFFFLICGSRLSSVVIQREKIPIEVLQKKWMICIASNGNEWTKKKLDHLDWICPYKYHFHYGKFLLSKKQIPNRDHFWAPMIFNRVLYTRFHLAGGWKVRGILSHN